MNCLGRSSRIYAAGRAEYAAGQAGKAA